MHRSDRRAKTLTFITAFLAYQLLRIARADSPFGRFRLNRMTPDRCLQWTKADQIKIDLHRESRSLIAAQDASTNFGSVMFRLFDRAAGFLPPRPQSVTAIARRRCQG